MKSYTNFQDWVHFEVLARHGLWFYLATRLYFSVTLDIYKVHLKPIKLFLALAFKSRYFSSNNFLTPTPPSFDLDYNGGGENRQQHLL